VVASTSDVGGLGVLMPFDPLKCPWGKSPQRPLDDRRVNEGHHIGKRNEAVRDSVGSLSFVTVRVMGVRGVPSGDYRVAYSPGAKLGFYFAKLGLKAASLRASVMDARNPSRGKLRMSYVPLEGAVIVLGRPGVSSALRLQSSNHDAQSVARRMGGGAESVSVKWKR
jgi:hypothetical protein